MAFNFGFNPAQPKTPQQLQAELTSMLQGQYAPVYNAFQQQQQMQSPIVNRPSTSGIYDRVSNYQEVENYPAPTDGNAVLLFNFENGVFYSKKFINGQSTIQTFTFMPLNTNANDDSQNSPKNTPNEPDTIALINSLADKIRVIEGRISKTKNTKKSESEVRDEL